MRRESRSSAFPFHLGFEAVHDGIGDEIGDERDDKEENADEEKDTIVSAAENNFTEFGGDRGGNGTRGIKDVAGDNAGIATGHEHDHGFANGASETQGDGGKDSGNSGGQGDLHGSLPGRSAEGKGRLDIAARHAAKSIFSDGENDGDDGEA